MKFRQFVFGDFEALGQRRSSRLRLVQPLLRHGQSNPCLSFSKRQNKTAGGLVGVCRKIERVRLLEKGNLAINYWVQPLSATQICWLFAGWPRPCIGEEGLHANLGRSEEHTSELQS